MAPIPRPAPHPGAKVDQSLLEIFRPLPGQPRALALAGEIRLVTTVAMARRQEAGDLSGIDGDLAFGGERGRRWQRCVVGAKIANVVVGQVLDDRLHDPRLAAAVAHEHQLVLGEDYPAGQPVTACSWWTRSLWRRDTRCMSGQSPAA